MVRWSRFNIASIVLGFAFLYLPILLLVVFSFNESRLVTVWAGFSTKWYGELFRNQGLIDAAWVTIQVGCDNTCAFCIVPSVRGEEISRPFDDLAESKLLFQCFPLNCPSGSPAPQHADAIGQRFPAQAEPSAPLPPLHQTGGSVHRPQLEWW